MRGTPVAPRLRVGFREVVGGRAAELPRRAGHEVIDPVHVRVLEIVLVAAEHHRHARTIEQWKQCGPRADRVLPRRMDVLQIAVVDELPGTLE